MKALRLLLLVTLGICLPLVSAPAESATYPAGFSETLVAGGLTNPTAMEFAPDGRLFVC